MTRNAMFEEIRDRVMKVSTFRLHSEVPLYYWLHCSIVGKSKYHQEKEE